MLTALQAYFNLKFWQYVAETTRDIYCVMYEDAYIDFMPFTQDERDQAFEDFAHGKFA